MIERTFCILKPDLTAKTRDVVAVLVRILGINLVPVRMLRTQMTRAEALELYQEHEGQSHFEPNVAFVTSGLVYLIVLEGEAACARLRELIGSTDPTKAQRGTLRQLFGSELPRNAVHGSASPAEAAREIEIFFGGPRS